ncbi:MAG: M48 family metallopeptidase [Burkholderiales bacterium]
MSEALNSISLIFSIIFAFALLASMLVKLWLAQRQVRHVSQHRGAVPAQFAEKISLPAHQKAADYTVANVRLGMVESMVGVVVLVAWTLLGGLNALNQALQHWALSAMVGQLVLLGSVLLIGGLVDLPFSWYRQFVLEQRFGFNRMSLGLWLADLCKGLVLGAAIGLPLAWLVLWLMGQAGSIWWIWAWGVVVVFNYLMIILFPTVIAPWFNKFSPLQNDELKARIEALLKRCGFRSSGVFVMDGSKRSSHGNAYFTGFGAGKRIVFFDTLIERLLPQEVEAVLAHELGHFKLRHIWKRMALSFALTLAFFALLGWLANQVWFYTGLGVLPSLTQPNDALALILFFFALPVFTFLLGPLGSWASRRHEFEADAFAAQQTNGRDLINALVKLYEDNASTLTPDPVYAQFYYSHPPAATRIERLQ